MRTGLHSPSISWPQEPCASSEHGLRILENLTHRGATGADPLQGDGAGILIQLPDVFFRRACGKLGITPPAIGQYGVGMVFPPREPASRMALREQKSERAIHAASARFFAGGATFPPTTAACRCGPRRSNPVIRQVFVARGSRDMDQDAFERKLYDHPASAPGARDPVAASAPRPGVLRAVVLDAHDHLQGHARSRTRSAQYYRDLHDESMVSRAGDGAPALLDQHVLRRGTLAHPFRFICHNGEINTLRGNFNWIRAREGAIASEGSRRRPAEAVAADLRRPVRFGVVRQRAGAARRWAAIRWRTR